MPHQRLFDDRPPHAGQPLVESPWYETASADGSIVSTAADMCAYARLLLGRGEGPGGRLLSEEASRLLTGRHVEDPDEEGRLVRLRARDAATSTGARCRALRAAWSAYSSYLMTDPEAGLGVVVLMNGIEERHELVKYALEAGRAAAAGQSLPEPPPPADPDAARRRRRRVRRGLPHAGR